MGDAVSNLSLSDLITGGKPSPFAGLDDAAAGYVKGQASSTAAQIRQNLGDAATSSPDQEAQLQRAAAATVTPISAARAMPQVVTQQAQAQGVDAASLTKRFPNLARFLTSPDNTRLVTDDLPGTAAVEQHVQSLGGVPIPAATGPQDIFSNQIATPLPQTYRQRIEASVRGFLGMPEAGMDQRQAAEATIALAAREAGQTPQEFTASTQTGASALTNIVRQFGQHFGSSYTAGVLQPDTPEPSGIGQTVAAGAGDLLGFLGGAGLKLASGLVAKATPAVLQRAVGDSFIKALGKDVTQQAAVLGIAGGVQSTGKALDTTNAGDAATAVGKGAAGGAEMGAVFGAAGRLLPENTVAQFAARVLGVNAAMDVSQGTSPWDNRSAEQKVFDYALNTFFAARGAGKVGGTWLHDAATADVATKDAGTLSNLAAASAVSKLRERNEDLFKNFVAEAANDNHIDAVYVDGTRLAEALHQSGIGTDELDSKLPALRGQMEQALATGGQVRIPIEDFATHIAGGPLEAPLIDHLRTDPEGMSKVEAEQFYQSQTEQMKGEAERVTSEQAQNQPFVDSQQKVHDAVLDQLNAANRFRPEVNQAYASLTRDFYTTMAGRADMLPHELYEQHPLSIGAESLAGSLQQGERGAYDPATGTIGLLKGADLTTTLHELGHHFFETMGRLASDASAPEGIKSDMATMLKAVGHEGDAASWQALSLEARREGHETIARGFEAYLMEGKAPSLELRGLFSRFRSWLLNAYQSLKSLRVDLTPEVRGVFDRMLASEEAIQHAEAARGYMQPGLPAKAGMSPEEYQAYHALGAEATNRALDELGPKTIRDMAWTDRARSSALKDLAKDAAEKRKVIRQEVESEIDKEPVYAASRFLKRGELPNGDTSDLHRLNLADMKAMYPEGGFEKLGYGKYGILGENGLHPDLVADQHGFGSGDAMVKALLTAQPRREAVTQETDRRMLERHGEVATPEALARAADDAVHNDIRARFVATEMKALTKSTGPVRELARAAKDVAGATIDARRVKDISERPFLAAETRANKAVREALKADDIAKAAVHSRDQLLNNALVRASLDAQKAVTKGIAYLKKFDRDGVRKNIDVDIRDQIDSLLERFDLRQAPETGPTRAQVDLRTWMETQEAAGYSPSIPRDLLDPVVRQHYKDMPVDLFKGLVDSVKALEHVGRERRTLTIDGKKQDLATFVNERLLPKIAETGRHFTEDELLERPEMRGGNDFSVAIDHFGSWMRGAAAQLKPQEFKRNQYDRHELLGPFGEAIFEPVVNANYRKVTLLQQTSKEFQKVADELGREWQDSMRQAMENRELVDPDKSANEDGTPQMLRMTRGRMLGIAIHVGNESNFAKLTKGWGWDGATVWRFLHDNMTEKDWTAVNTVWHLNDSLWPEMEAMNRRLGNTMPERIEPRPFKTKFGELPGGYAAIAYDPLRSRRGEKDEQGRAMDPQDGLFSRDYYRPDTTTNGSMNARVEGYNDRVDLDFHTIARKLNESVHDLAYREALLDVNKVLEQPDFRKAFRSAYGREAYQSMRDWLGRLANGNTVDAQVGALGKFLQYTRTGIVINAIAFRATTVLKHGGSAGIKTTGYFIGGGEKYLASRMASMTTDYSAQIAGAREKFGEIRNRLSQQDRDFRQVSTNLFEPDTKLAWAHRAGHAAVAWSDMITAVPTAWAAYDRAIVEGIPKSQGGTGEPMTEAQAVNYANKIVREAHGSTAESSRSMLLNSTSEPMKMFTTLFGFMNNTYGQQLDGFDKLRTSGITSGPVLARSFMAIIVPALWAAYLTHGAPADDKKDGWAKWISKAIGEEVASSVPFVRDAVAMVEGYQHAGVVGVESWVATMVKAATSLEKAATTGGGKPIRDIANAVGMGLHIPGLGQAGQSLQYIQDVRDGKVERPKSSFEYAKGVVLGHGERKH